ncbi:GMC family oxidoreductase [Frankia sp. QA3]|uniref:GMC family oxidoreductase n=1 Tax=Frankia sp. QA3 TaxID=710111 RepID=UPI000269B6CB|nr:GMC family oxidoreductase N-terminal domain-containing protein [Frankia sp. QA3]EIV90885.1 choline dehydrogenase-like flavoprotein [Frankia sp. QA3]
MTDEVFDYVVVGGGSSGSVIASRLTEANAKVLLLEAGRSDRRLEILVPAGVAVAYKKANWKYPAEPDPSRRNRPEAWMAGRVMGGGGSINSCVYIRGNRADYDGWAQLGCKGWDYDSVLPAFKKIETWEGGENTFRGGSGPVSVCVQENRGEANQTYIKAARQAGYTETADYNGEQQEGIALAQVNHRRGTRSQSSREYIKRVASKKLLTVRTNAFAHRVLLEGTAAVGVEYRHQGELRRARARQEVILSAGTLASPKLLLQSGIGPRAHLEDHNIPVVLDLPGVGENLHEHAYLMQRYRTTMHTINKPRLSDGTKAVTDFALHGGGILAMTIVQVQVMARSDTSLASPDIQLQFTPFAITRNVDDRGMFDVQPARELGFTASSTFTHTRNRGRISLHGSDPTLGPRIEMQLLGHPDDLRDTVRGAMMVHEIMAQPAMAEITRGQFQPEADCVTEADWINYVRDYAVPSYHPVGSCKMGVDDAAVVDPALRVRGIANLRVVDASIMPNVTTGNTNAPSMMIGERGAELVLGRS